MLCAVSDFHSFENIFNTFLTIAGFHFQIDQRQLNIFVNIKFVYQVKALEDKSDISFTEDCPVAFFQVSYLSSVEDVTSGTWVIKQTKNIKQGGFSAS